jgi:Lipocalin-like domain
MLAYSGKYRTEGNKIIINVDIVWDELWTGTEQVRYYRIEGDQLHIEAAPQPYAKFWRPGIARHLELDERDLSSD